jgi:PTH1 family peptidyl-tRNA hydrolase
MTFMNESSKAVGEAVRFLKVPLDRVVVFHDELDIAPGKVRMKKGGGAGGHNGLRDIDAHVGNDYRRVRIGIGHPGHKDLVLHWVLRNFEPDETDPKDGWVPKVLHALAEESALLVEGGAKADEKYMSRVAHLAPPPDLPARLNLKDT